MQQIQEPAAIQAGGAGDFPRIVVPARPVLFSRRAQRLRELAEAHPLADYLRFIAQLADMQQAVLDAAPPVPPPAAQSLERAQRHGMPPLDAQERPCDPAWQGGLKALLQHAAAQVHGPAADLVAAVGEWDAQRADAQAEKVLNGITAGLDFGAAPLIGAALQVHWVNRVTSLPAPPPAIDVASLCPACGMRPVASIVRGAGQAGGHRYLHCALCSTEWHMVRIKCSDCESTTGIQYFGIDGDAGAAKAEYCSGCNGYLKIFSMERDPRAEPLADDLASVALDLLMADAGRQRNGPNLMLFSTDSA